LSSFSLFSLSFFFQANENDYNEDDYLVDHSIVIYFVGPDGQFLDFFTQRSQVGDVIDKIAKEVQQGDKKKK
jgi:protein SCO1/2